MRRTLIFLAAAGVGAASVAAGTAPMSRSERAATDFARVIAGKTPGKPQECIETRFAKPTLSAYGSKLVYRVDRNLVYVSETNGGCENVARGDALLTRQFQSRLCRGDIAETINFPVGITSGSCALGAFVPYRTR